MATGAASRVIALPRSALIAATVAEERDGEQHLSVLELRAVLDHFRANAPAWYPLHLTLALTSARWGEVAAMKWSDIGFEAGVIRLRRAHYRGKVGAMKTDKKGRTVKVIPMLPELAEALRVHRRHQLEKQIPGLAEGWVFPTEAGTLHVSTSSATKPLRAALKDVGVERRFTIHGYRHTLDGLLVEAAGGEVARSITGHVTPAMTEHYDHIDLERRRSALVRALQRGRKVAVDPPTASSGLTQNPERANDPAPLRV